MMEVVRLASEFVAVSKERGMDACWKSALDALLSEVGRCEERGVPKDALRGALGEVRRIHAQSPFIRRLQEWPRGYAGDFETIEYICDRRNCAHPGSIGYELEQLALDSSIAQQHRNKVFAQAACMLEQAVRKPDSRFLLVGCGGGRDLRMALDFGRFEEARFVLNDIDSEALRFAKDSIAGAKLGNVDFLEGNIVRLARGNRLGDVGFDLVLFGGVFDYLPPKAIRAVLAWIYAERLNRGGKIVFTNIRQGNPYRIWIEYCADWELLERSELECIALCRDSGVPDRAIRIRQDDSGLTWIVECERV